MPPPNFRATTLSLSHTHTHPHHAPLTAGSRSRESHSSHFWWALSIRVCSMVVEVGRAIAGVFLRTHDLSSQIAQACRPFRFGHAWRSMSTQSPLFPWGDRSSEEGQGASSGTSERQAGAEKRRWNSTPGVRQPSFASPGSMVDWAFSTLHCSDLLRVLVGGRFGHKYWGSGWGDPGLLSHLSQVHTQRFGDTSCGSLYRDANDDVSKALSWTCQAVHASGVSVWEGVFQSPVSDGSLPPESCLARCQLILPPGCSPPNAPPHTADVGVGSVPALVHLAGLGDYTYGMRRLMMWPLAQEHGVASVILQVRPNGE